MEKETDKFLNDCVVEDAIEYFGPNNIMDAIEPSDITGYIETHPLVLDNVEIDYIVETIDSASMIKELTDRGFSVDEIDKEEDIIKTLKNVCRELQPNGYIGKEEAKKLLCDYLDFWMDMSF